MKNESQYGLLLLQQYLYEHTDDRHPVSVADILAFWQEHGIQAGRKSVYSAIEVLQSSGMDIVCVKSTQNQYFVGERLFELPELKLLVDAVESSRFITAKKSERLIGKLGKLTSESHARQLDRHIYMEGTAKPENECIYYSVDEIHNAIQDKRQITFQYYEYTPQKEKILKHNGYRYQFSPYALIWSRDCYYAVGWSEKHGKLAQFRVDRMVAVESSDQAAVCMPDFDPAEYVRKIFGMYPDDLCTVELLCENEVMRSVIDRFGEEVSTVTADDGHFKAIVEVAPSPPFFCMGVHLLRQDPNPRPRRGAGRNARHGRMAAMIQQRCSLRGTPLLSHLANRTDVCYTGTVPNRENARGGEMRGTDLWQLPSGEAYGARPDAPRHGGKAGLVAGLYEQH